MYKIQKKIDKCLDLVARDEKVVAASTFPIIPLPWKAGREKS